MNELEKRSFYSFVGLYIVSSFIFITVIGYWYYSAQKHALENEHYYRLEHLADHISGEIIVAHMQGHTHAKFKVPKDITLALVDTDGKVVEGRLLNAVPHQAGYFNRQGYTVLVSDAPREHLNIKYVILQSNSLSKAVAALQKRVMVVIFVSALIIAMIAWLLSHLFMRPVRQRVRQIERFINDITHELNTPISSLSMSTEQAFKKGVCSEKMLKNIAISTRQLYDIYRSLTYLNFSAKEEAAEVIALDEVLQKSVTYYRPLAEVKQINIKIETEPTQFPMPSSKATLLFGNLIGNAIKYSPKGATVEISLKERMLRIQDQGIGIAPEKQQRIFQRFERGTEYSGGFGVGLSIVKSICDHYHMRISLNSEVGKGTEFILYFP